GGDPLPADPDDVFGDVPRPDPDGVPGAVRHPRRRVERPAGEGGGGRAAVVNLSDAVRGADHVHAADEGPAAGGGGPGGRAGGRAGRGGGGARVASSPRVATRGL